MWLSVAKCKWFAYGPADATATHHLFLQQNLEWFCLSGTGLSRMSWKRGRKMGVVVTITKVTTYWTIRCKCDQKYCEGPEESFPMPQTVTHQDVPVKRNWSLKVLWLRMPMHLTTWPAGKIPATSLASPHFPGRVLLSLSIQSSLQASFLANHRQFSTTLC